MKMKNKYVKKYLIALEIIGIVIILFFQVTLADDTTDPELNFIDPTPDNNYYQTQRYVNVNISIEEENLDELVYNWDETNYTMYNDSLILMYNFDKVSALGENNIHIVDVSNYGNDGTAMDGSDYTSSGKYEGGFNFDGIDDCINIGKKVVTIHSFSAFMWIYVQGDYYGGIIGQDTDTGVNREWFIAYHYGYELRTRMYNTIGTEFEGNTIDDNITLNTWYHVGIVIDNATKTMKSYIDGVNVNTTTYSGILDTTRNAFTEIGRTYSNGYTFKGSIDEVRIWNRSLSGDEIYQHYVSNLNKYNTTQWYLNINQSKTATQGLDDGIYTYQAFAQDTGNLQTASEQRTIYINVDPTPPVPEASTLLMMSIGLLSLLSITYLKKRNNGI